ncbi:hypothetical protein Q760_04385 [Cellulomonas cellasea DSM 20118]|uniref:Core-binding (CB) domain-containing protein n=1 Tax=Cellulomonas cellasea DSM 20118 TaxID=1408250 RepID=A0A0A0B718_9CELL|nr:hypothetical protein Q760_04385 [Cellulomonas cellasea DSM 20118]
MRSCAYDLLRWWRWLSAVRVEWDKATPDDGREYSLWLRSAVKPGADGRTSSVATAGTVNPVTPKQYLDDRYQPRTVRHANAVLRAFYEHWDDPATPDATTRPGSRRRARGRGHDVQHLSISAKQLTAHVTVLVSPHRSPRTAVVMSSSA